MIKILFILLLLQNYLINIKRILTYQQQQLDHFDILNATFGQFPTV